MYIPWHIVSFGLLVSLLGRAVAAPASSVSSGDSERSSSPGSPLPDFPILPYKKGDIVGVRPSEYEDRPPKEISIHPGVVIGGPNHEGKYSVAMMSKKLPGNPPQADIRHFHPAANVYGNVALSPAKEARPKAMKPWKSDKTGETAIPVSKHGVEAIKDAMVPHQDWRAPTPPPRPVKQKQKGKQKGGGSRKYPNPPQNNMMHPPNPHNPQSAHGSSHGGHPGPVNNPFLPPGPPNRYDHSSNYHHQQPQQHPQAGPSRLPRLPTTHSQYAAATHHNGPYPPMNGPGGHPSGSHGPYPHPGPFHGPPSGPYHMPVPQNAHLNQGHHMGGPAPAFPVPHHFNANNGPHPATYHGGPPFNQPHPPPGPYVYHPGPPGSNIHPPPQHLAAPGPYPNQPAFHHTGPPGPPPPHFNPHPNMNNAHHPAPPGPFYSNKGPSKPSRKYR